MIPIAVPIIGITDPIVVITNQNHGFGTPKARKAIRATKPCKIATRGIPIAFDFTILPISFPKILMFSGRIGK